MNFELGRLLLLGAKAIDMDHHRPCDVTRRYYYYYECDIVEVGNDCEDDDHSEVTNRVWWTQSVEEVVVVFDVGIVS